MPSFCTAPDVDMLLLTVGSYVTTTREFLSEKPAIDRIPRGVGKSPVDSNNVNVIISSRNGYVLVLGDRFSSRLIVFN